MEERLAERVTVLLLLQGNDYIEVSFLDGCTLPQ